MIYGDNHKMNMDHKAFVSLLLVVLGTRLKLLSCSSCVQSKPLHWSHCQLLHVPSCIHVLLHLNIQTNVIFTDVQENPLLKQMQVADSGETELETESPGGISETLFSQ